MTQTQADRYTKLCALTAKNFLGSDYHAAFYLLSYDPDVYEVACRFVNHEGIKFSKLKLAISGFDERTRFVVDIAHNLFSHNSPCEATPFEISRLGCPLMEQVCNALYISACEIAIEIKSDENSQAKIILNDDHYKKTKMFTKAIEKLTSSF